MSAALLNFYQKPFFAIRSPPFYGSGAGGCYGAWAAHFKLDASAIADLDMMTTEFFREVVQRYAVILLIVTFRH